MLCLPCVLLFTPFPLSLAVLLLNSSCSSLPLCIFLLLQLSKSDTLCFIGIGVTLAVLSTWPVLFICDSFLSLLLLIGVFFYPSHSPRSPTLKFDILPDVCHLVTHAPPCCWIRFGQTHLKVSCVYVCMCSTLLLSSGM